MAVAAERTFVDVEKAEIDSSHSFVVVELEMGQVGELTVRHCLRA